MVPASERPEERHGEAGRISVALEHGATIGFLPAAVLAIEAFVEHADGPVIAQRVGRRHVRQSALEAVVEAHDLEPFALVPLDVEWTYRLNALWYSRAATDECGQQQKDEKGLLRRIFQCFVPLARQSQGISKLPDQIPSLARFARSSSAT